MKKLLIVFTVVTLFGCGNQNKVKMETNNEDEKIGTIILVMTKTKAEYDQTEVIQLSKAIDPMVNKFEGYLGRKMSFANNDQGLLVDVVYYTDEKAAADAAEKEAKSETCGKFFATLDNSATKMWMLSPATITNSKKGETKTIELVLFKTKQEYARKEVIKAGEAINSILESLDGFISRKLAFTKDGDWMDLVYWTDLQKAESASKAILNNEIAKKYFGMIDEATMQFMHLNVVIDTEKIKKL